MGTPGGGPISAASAVEITPQAANVRVQVQDLSVDGCRCDSMGSMVYRIHTPDYPQNYPRLPRN